MNDGFDAEGLAAVARGDDPDPVDDGSVTDDHAAAEGADPSDDIGSTSAWRDRLLSTEPNPPLSAVDSPWNPEQGGPTRIMRGIQKMGDFAGLPALADITIGALEWGQTLNLDEPGEQDDDQDAGAPTEEDALV